MPGRRVCELYTAHRQLAPPSYNTIGREVRDPPVPKAFVLTFAAFLLALRPAPLSAVLSLIFRVAFLGPAAPKAGGCVSSIAVVHRLNVLILRRRFARFTVRLSPSG